MRFILPVLALAAAVVANNTPSPIAPLTIAAPDGSLKATFIRLGATLTNFWTKDRTGKLRDIHLGYDNFTNYQTDALGHPYFGPIVGRYANRIKNGTFVVDGKTFHVPENENGGIDTLHGGLIGFDRRNWTLAASSKNSLTFTLVDPNGTQGFPGTVTATVTYTLNSKGQFHIAMHATATARTPIMLSAHNYWNLEAYVESQDLLGHFAQFQASRVIGTDGILVPDGSIINVTGNALDFRKAKSIGVSLESSLFCGTGCVGFDNCWIYDNNNGKTPVFSLWSELSGIRMDVTTDQPALQIYTCNGIFNPNVPIPRKKDQGMGHYTDHSCLVIEQESWIDAINQPSFGIDQIYGPTRPYVWDAVYSFSVMK